MKWIATLTLFLTYYLVFAQPLTKQYIENRAVKFNPATKGLPITAYIVDGEILEPGSEKFNSFLNSKSRTDIAYIYGVRTEDVFPTTENPGKTVILISVKGTETKKQKQELLKSAIAKYDSSENYFDHISRNSKDPVLFINDHEIYFSQCRKELLKMKSSDIYAITVYEHAVPPEFYGENAKNGLIEIWTYPAKK